MKNIATKSLPEGYILARTLDLRQTKNLLVVNLFGLVLLIVSWIGFAGLANALHPGSMNFSFSSGAIGSAMLSLLAFVIVIVVMFIVHEGFHGLCFWIFTKNASAVCVQGCLCLCRRPGLVSCPKAST